MAVRTTVNAVLDILGKDYDSVNEPSLTGYMATASNVVDDVRTAAVEDDVTYSFTKLELIERWLTAYFYTLSDPTYTSRSTGGASGSFLVEKENQYLSGAKKLDPEGYLNSILSGNRAKAFWLGTPDYDAQSYADRN